MPQPSIAYAVGRVRAQARKPLGESQLERLMASSSYQDARHVLAEMGWTGAQEEDITQLSVRMQEAVCKKIREITPDPDLTDAFLLRYDAQNLKTLLKARILNEQPESLSLCGTIPPDILQHAVAERVYGRLPLLFSKAMQTLEKSIALRVNPMEIDARIDQALYQLIQNKISRNKSKAASDFFRSKADLQNAVTFLRLKAMKETDIPFLDLLLPGGKIKKTVWMQTEHQADRLPRLFSSYGQRITAAVKAALEDHKAIPALEKEGDDYLLHLFTPYRHDPFAIEVLIGWLLAHEREAGAVRLIMAGKRNGFSQEIIRERLREAYGR